MISKFSAAVLFAAATFLLATSPVSFADARQTKINKLTKDLKKLPERDAPTSRILSLVKKLVKLQPNKTSQYYALGLRKSGASGEAGDQFSASLNTQIQRVLAQTNLPQSEKDAQVRRLNKIERLYVPPQVQPTPTPYQAMGHSGVYRELV